MSDKRKKHKYAAKREARRKKWEQDTIHRTAEGKPIPQGAVPVDPQQLSHWNTYSPLPEFYFDQFFHCRDCGQAEVWTAERQKWYFEEAKGKIGGRAIRCRACRKKRREQQNPEGRRGDPWPVKHPAVLLKRVRVALEPALRAAGFEHAGRGREPRHWWLDYLRGEELLAISFRYIYDQNLLNCELADAEGELATIAELPGNALWAANREPERLEAFCEQVRRFVERSAGGSTSAAVS